MIIRKSLIIALSSLPTLLGAQTIDVISGEHEDFSRLVLELPIEVDWKIHRSDEGYVLSTSSDNIDYNLGKVFEYIPKTRISKVEALSRGGLEIYTRPLFHLDAFEIRAGRLVIDIKDGLPADNSKFEISAPKAGKNIQVQQSNTKVAEVNASIESGQFSDKDKSTILDEVQNPLFFDANKTQTILPSMIELSVKGPAINEYLPPFIDPLSPSSSRASEMEEAVFSQIGRAISQGLLQVDLPEIERAVEAKQKLLQVRAPTAEPTPPKLPIELSLSDSTHVRVQTSIDRDRRASNSSRSGGDEMGTCPAESLLAIEQWGEPPSDGLLLSEFRNRTIGEFDQPLEMGVESLAKYYLYLSFGSEAKAVLNEFGIFVKNAGLLKLIADVMDDGYSDNFNLLEQYSDCSGATGFFSAMSQQILNSQRDYEDSEVVAYFSGLPLHLRRHLGPALSEKFLSAGAPQTAKLIQNAISRAEGVNGDAYDLLNAEMQLLDGETDEAINILDGIVDLDGTGSAAALIRAIEIRAAQSLDISPKTAELAEILMIEHRGAPLEDDLILAFITAQTYSKNPDLALETLSQANTVQLLPPAVQKKLINEAVMELVSSFEDLPFAKVAVSLIGTDTAKLLTDTSKVQIAERMVQIGFSDLASGFLDLKGELDDRARMVFGQVARSQFLNDEALSYLMGVGSFDASQMRAEIYLDLNMPEKAAEEFEVASQLEAANNANLISENWEGLSSSGNQNYSSLADHMKGEKPNTASEDITLSNAKALLEYSKSSRTLFKNLVQ